MLYKKVKIRQRKTQHTGGTPKNIAGKKSISKTSQKKELEEQNMAVQEVVKTGISAANPTSSMFQELAMRGAGVTLGLGLSRVVGGALSQRMPSLGPISNQTITSAAVTALMATLAKKGPLKGKFAKEVLMTGAASGAVVMAGSLIFDALRALNVNAGQLGTALIAGVTGASPVMVAKSKGNEEGVDLDTKFA